MKVGERQRGCGADIRQNEAPLADRAAPPTGAVRGQWAKRIAGESD
jgi:hypothetical protein